MFENIEPGITHCEEKTVTFNDTAAYYGSGMVEVFATPAMIALMEHTAMKAVLGYLPEGYKTVGTEVCVKHFKATPMNKVVRCEARLEKKDGQKLFYTVLAFDNEGPIGSGTHSRYIINTKEFMEGLTKKL